jgi:hypothetical protein
LLFSFKIRAQHVLGWFPWVCAVTTSLYSALPGTPPCVAGRGRLGLAVAWSCLGHSGRNTCCQPRGAVAARVRVERPPLAPMPSPALARPPRLHAALPSGHATLPHHPRFAKARTGLELGPGRQSRSMTPSIAAMQRVPVSPCSWLAAIGGGPAAALRVKHVKPSLLVGSPVHMLVLRSSIEVAVLTRSSRSYVLCSYPWPLRVQRLRSSSPTNPLLGFRLNSSHQRVV